MNFRHVNPHNVAWLVPSWSIEPFAVARKLEEVLSRFDGPRRAWDQQQGFWIEIWERGDRWEFLLRTPDEAGAGREDCGHVMIVAEGWALRFPVNEILRGAPALRGSHCVYQHCFDVETPAAYIGVTKQRWFDRYAQHLSSARSGSPYLFHRAIREHGERRSFHRVITSLLSEDDAMRLEEELVGMFSLYPLGLNMIPGGRAGIRYLHNLGVAVGNAADRDAAVERLAGEPSRAGRPNPLCAARWESDPDFNARVICGHSGRLTVEQLRVIRTLARQGISAAEIADRTGDSKRRVAAVLAGKRYARVA